MRNCYIGVDPGAKGFAVFYYPANDTYESIPLSDINRVRSELEGAKVIGDSYAVIENVHALPKQGLSSTFKFGYNVGLITGMFIAFGIPYSTAAPVKWQREMWDSTDRVVENGKVDTKKTSYNAVRRLHPFMDFRKSERSTKFDDNLVDATLICDYAKRMNL